MLEQLLQMADGPLQDYLAKSGVQGQAGSAKAIQETLGSLLTQQAKNGNLDAVKEMFSGSQTAADSPVVANLSGEMVSSLSSKLGIDSKQAMSMVMAALPMLMNFFNQKVNDAPQANNDIMDSIANAVSGKGGAGAGDILGSLLGGSGGKGGMDLGGLMDLGKNLFK